MNLKDKFQFFMDDEVKQDWLYITKTSEGALVIAMRRGLSIKEADNLIEQMLEEYDNIGNLPIKLNEEAYTKFADNIRKELNLDVEDFNEITIKGFQFTGTRKNVT